MKDIQKCWNMSSKEVFEKLETSETGLTSIEAKDLKSLVKCFR